MTVHKHAELMALYAQDAAETDKPWLRWEFLSEDKATWGALTQHPSWQTFLDYRRKVPTIRIGEFDVPEPLRDAPKVGTPYWIAAPTDDMYTLRATWQNSRTGRIWLRRGLVHLTQEAAELHAQAWLSLTEG